MQLDDEICGARVEAWGTDADVWVRVGDATCSPSEIDALAVSHADWTRTVTVGGCVFGSAALAELKAFVAAARAEFASIPTP